VNRRAVAHVGHLLRGVVVVALVGAALGVEASLLDAETPAKGISCPTEPGPQTEKESIMETARTMEPLQRTLPPIDAVRPARTEVATFALG